MLTTMVFYMPDNNDVPSRDGEEGSLQNLSNSHVFETKWDYIIYLIEKGIIYRDMRRHDDDLIHLCGTLPIDSRVKKGLNWDDVVVTSAIVEPGMVSKYQYLPKTYKGVKTTLKIPSLELYMKHNNYNAVCTDNKYYVDLFRISEQASDLDFSSVSANLTLFYGDHIALSHLPKSKSILGISTKNLEIDCQDSYRVAKQKGCSEEILSVLRPQSSIATYFYRFVGKKGGSSKKV